MQPLVATVLPPREGFSPGAVGAIGLLVRRLAPAGGIVVGLPAEHPFDDVAFVPAPPRLALGGALERYAAGVAAVLRPLRPALVEVHNRPAVARRLAHALPGARVALVLHNDPQGMRGARTAAERGRLLAHMRVACVSGYLRRRLLDGVAGAAEVAVLPNCLALDALPPRLAPGEREPVLLFAGRLVADKGADAFVAACAAVLPRLPGWRAEMIGADRFSPDSPDTPFLRALRPAAAAAGVTLAGYRPHAAVLAAMARAAVVAVPSRWEEPFGLTALEAMASGAALVASPRGELAALAEGAALLADPDEPGALAAALLALAGDPARRQAVAQAGLARAAAHDAPAAIARLRAFRAGVLGLPEAALPRGCRAAPPPVLAAGGA